MPKTPADIRSLCRAFTNETVQIVAGIARAAETPPAVRVQAIGMLWDRGWGKPAQAHTGEDGEGDIRITIRHFLESSGKPVPGVNSANRDAVRIAAPTDAEPDDTED